MGMNGTGRRHLFVAVLNLLLRGPVIQADHERNPDARSIPWNAALSAAG
ncbi:hypothetical protein [Tropicimonas isoalkanivorans]|nr:hypothetical protein [Tropicimonas isoalkanivorans]